MIDPDDLAIITGAVQHTIQNHVNGKIDKIDAKLDKHIRESDEYRKRADTFMKELKPARNTIRFLQYLQQFYKWLGIPLTALIAWVLLKN